MLVQLKRELEHLLSHYLKNYYNKENLIVLEEPKDSALGDLSIPLFGVAKDLQMKLPEVFKLLEEVIKSSKIIIYIDKIDLMRGFLNIKLNKQKCAHRMFELLKLFKENDLQLFEQKDETMVIDYSSPNIAKPFSIGHLRSTIIGNALANIYEKCGIQTVRINYLGDWGTQFGKLIVAYQRWGSAEAIEKDPINELLELYVRFHEEVEQDIDLEEEGRIAFSKLESGHEGYLKLWKWFRDESLKEFMRMYDLLNVSFDSYHGEAFYNDKMEAVVDELTQKGLLEFDKEAYIVRLEDDLPPALIKKRDGSSLYLTRDIAAVFYRKNTYHFNQALYVVGNEQSLHFNQLKQVVKKMGYNYNQQMHHVNFGLVMQDGKKMSTRKGKIVKLHDVLTEAINMAKDYMTVKNNDLAEIDQVAKQIGVSAVIYNDLKNHRTKDIEFNLEQMLKFEGNTGPYLQYTSVRINSILSKQSYDSTRFDVNTLAIDQYFELLKQLSQYEAVVLKAKEELDPSIIAKYAYQIAKEFNKIYAHDQFMVEDELERNTKLVFLSNVKTILDDCLQLLGMSVIEKM